MNRNTNRFVVIAAFVVIIVCLITIIRLQINFNALNEEKEELSRQVAQYADEIDELKSEIERPFDDEYIMRVAREKLGYHLPDEIIYYNDLK